MEKKYYWIKLKRDFFKRHDIQIIEAMPNGKDYVLFYLKLLLESVGHDGALRFSDTIPYNEQMLSTITNTNIDVVRAAMKIFAELNMVDILDDKTIYMSELNKMVGSETEWARKKRLYRAKEDNVLPLSDCCPPTVRQEIELEKEIDKEKDSKPTAFDLFWKAYPKKVGKEAARKAFAKAKVDINTLISAVEQQKLSDQWRKDNGQYIPNPTTWLNQGRWDDELSGIDKPVEQAKPKKYREVVINGETILEVIADAE